MTISSDKVVPLSTSKKREESYESLKSGDDESTIKRKLAKSSKKSQ